MGAGNKVNPSMFEVADIYKTSVDPLARVMRQAMKKRGVKKIKSCLFKEEPLKPLANTAVLKRTPVYAAHCLQATPLLLL